ncbi:MAG: GerAB/ArcD/ProY family transporter [Desulfotomaculales bacterium]
MSEQGKIDGKQAVMLMLSTVLPTAILTVPAVVVGFARQDAWLSIGIATAAGLLIARLVVSLNLRFPGKTLVEYAEEILGKVPGKIVGLLYIWGFFLYVGAGVVREFAVFMVTAVMPETPIIVFSIMIVAVAAYAIRNGLEVLCRFNQLFIPLVGLLAIVFALSVKDMRLARLLPVFDAGLIPVIKGSVAPAMWLGQIVIFAMIIPYLHRPRDAHRVATFSLLLISFFLTASILEALLIFGPYVASAWIFPTFNAVRVVSIANFLERLESVVVAVWVIGAFVKVGVFYYAAVLGSAQWLGLRDFRPLVAPVGLLLVVLSILLWGENIIEMLHLVTEVYVPFSLLVFESGIPLLLLVTAVGRRKGGKAAG